MCTQITGWVSAKYESGGLGCGAVSTGHSDPGGVSFGTYQLSSTAGTLQKFLAASKYYLKFAGMPAGQSAFNAQWKHLAATDPLFCQAQHDFIKATHFDPVRTYFLTKGDTSSCAIDEALWSASVQHGYVGNKIIIDNAYNNICDNYTDIDLIKSLYHARNNYIDGIAALSDAMKLSIHNRYTAELADILSIQD